MKERKTELSVLNVLLCLTVIFIHVSSAPVAYLERASFSLAAVFVPWKIASFAVYGFIFLGGLRFSLHPPKEGRGLWEYYKKRLLRVVLPYAVWVLIYRLLNHFGSGDPAYSEPFSPAGYLWSFVSGTPAAHLYYVVITVQLCALAPLWRRLKKESAAVVLPPALLLTFMLHRCLPEILARLGYTGSVLNDRIFTTYLFFWLAGVYAGLWYEEFCAFVKRAKAGITVFFLLCAVSEVWLNYLNYAFEDWVSFLNELHYLYLIAAILFFFMLAQEIRGLALFRSRAFTQLDRCTYSIYLSHLFIMSLWDGFQARCLPQLTIMQAYPLRILVTYAVTLCACLLTAYLVNIIRKRLKKQPST